MSKYVTVQDDTFDSISRKSFGTEEKAGIIAASNPGLIEPFVAGLSITIPDEAKAKVAPSSLSTSNELSLSIDSDRFRFWTDLTYTNKIDSIDTIDFFAPFEPSNWALRDVFKPLSYRPTEIFIGDELLFSGVQVPIDPDSNSNSNTISTSSYSRPGVLMDCMPSPSSLPLEFTDANLETIANKVCEPFGINVFFDDGPGPAFRRVSISPVQKVFGQLADLAAQRNLLVSNTEFGDLVFFTPISTGTPVAKLDGSKTPVTKVKAQINAQSYYSHVTGFRGAKTGREGASYTFKNPLLEGVFRPYSFEVTDIKSSELEAAVKSKMGRMIGNFVSWSVSLNTWRDPQGALWKPNTFTSLVDPRNMIYEPYLFLIKTVGLRRKSKSETAVLNVVLPGAYSGEIPESLPWET